MYPGLNLQPGQRLGSLQAADVYGSSLGPTTSQMGNPMIAPAAIAAAHESTAAPAAMSFAHALLTTPAGVAGLIAGVLIVLSLSD